jgi:hypothetical protein
MLMANPSEIHAVLVAERKYHMMETSGKHCNYYGSL